MPRRKEKQQKPFLAAQISGMPHAFNPILDCVSKSLKAKSDAQGICESDSGYLQRTVSMKLQKTNDTIYHEIQNHFGSSGKHVKREESQCRLTLNTVNLKGSLEIEFGKEALKSSLRKNFEVDMSFELEKADFDQRVNGNQNC